MKQALQLLFGVLALLLGAYGTLGFDLVYHLAYGVVAAMAAVISGTFLWLWWARATPLALGMAFSWGGATCVMGWWWAFALAGQPMTMLAHPVVFLFPAAYLVGAILHFQVIHRTLGIPGGIFWALPAALIALVFAAQALLG